MNSVIKDIIKNAMFDDTLLAEAITYNGTAIMAIVEIGATGKIDSPAIYHARNTVEVYSDGFFTVKTSDVANPQRGDKIVYNSKTYFVSNIAMLDSVGGNVTVAVRTDERVYKN